MTDLDDRITRVLAERAHDTDVEDRLDDVSSGGHVVRWTEITDDRERSRSRTVAAVAAGLLIVAGGFALTQLDRSADLSPSATDPDEMQPSASAADPSGRVFPMMGTIPDGMSDITFASAVTFVKPATTSVTLARIDGDHIVDITAVSAANADESSRDDVLVPPDAQTSEQTVGGRRVTVYDNAGGRWYRWSDDGVVVLVQASQDSDAIIGELSTTSDSATGIVDIDFGELPAGLEVVAAPEPLIGNHPGLSTDSGPGEPSFDLFPTDMPLTVDTDVVDAYSIVDVNGAVGYTVATSDGAIVTWPTTDGVWLRLSASDTDASRLTDIARDVRLVDEAAWRTEYGDGFTMRDAPTPSTQP